jgi:hypothetical protein
LLPIRFHSVSL